MAHSLIKGPITEGRNCKTLGNEQSPKISFVASEGSVVFLAELAHIASRALNTEQAQIALYMSSCGVSPMNTAWDTLIQIQDCCPCYEPVS